MKIEYTKEKGGKLSFFQDLYSHANSLLTEDLELLRRHLEQYNGSEDIDGSSEKASVVRNITYELIESQITSYIPTPHVDPSVFSDRNLRCAKSIETLLKRSRAALPFDYMNDLDERYSYIYGGSVWLVEWDESIVTHNTVGGVRVTCIPPLDFVPQPNIYNIDEMEYCFVKFTSTKDDIARKYCIPLSVAEEAENAESGDDDTASVIVCFYKDEDGKICEYVWSDETELLDIPDYYARKKKVCKKCGERKELCRCEKPKESNYEDVSDEFEYLDEDIELSDGEKIKYGSIVTKSVEVADYGPNGEMLFDNINGQMLPRMKQIEEPVFVQTKIPYYAPNMLPIVIRKNTSKEKSLLGQSDCAYIRPQQQAINKVESRIMQKLMRSGITPVVPEDATITVNNSIFGQVIKMKPGESAAQYGKIDTTPDISRDVVEAERLYDHAKRILGITDSFQGQYDSSAQSGKAKQLQIQQAAGRLQSKRKMKNSAYARIDKIIFQYYLAYADEPRPATYLDKYGRLQNSQFNRYDFVRVDEGGNYYYDDEFIFSSDETIDPDQNREYLWELNLNNLKLGTYGNPEEPLTMLRYWQCQERAHYPHARENVEYFREQLERAEQVASQASTPTNLTPAGGNENGI